jgi:hypothetical protein
MALRTRVLAAVTAGLLLTAGIGATSATSSVTDVDCRSGADLQAALDTASGGETLRIRGTYCRDTGLRAPLG